MRKSLKERWNDECSLGDKEGDYFLAKIIISDAYYEGFIKWNSYQKAMDRVKTKMNGDWMFEKQTNQ